MESSQKEKDAVEVVLAKGATLRRWGGRDEQMGKLDLMIPGSESLGTDPATVHLRSCLSISAVNLVLVVITVLPRTHLAEPNHRPFALAKLDPTMGHFH